MCCSQADQIRCPEDASHQHWCEKLACYMSHDSQLAELPFSYATEVTADDFDLEHFLNKNKLDSGYWLHWSLLVRSPRFELHPTVEQSRDPYLHWFTVLWSQYYEWRGISLSSPAAVLLSSPLSIYYIITSLVPKDFPELNIQKKQSLKIHIIDSYREFHCLMVFWELSILLPHMTFELVFIGEGLPPESDKEQLFLQKKDGRVNLVNPSFTPDEKLDRRSIRVKGYRRAYHMLQGPKPDLVIGEYTVCWERCVCVRVSVCKQDLEWVSCLYVSCVCVYFIVCTFLCTRLSPVGSQAVLLTVLLNR
uniref:Mitochondrial splicing suppressor 51-like C-terminal domain-containing protein n=1 Tax=Hucho hucho TaxID=62062 RepID=A0A4W5QRW0_9TELE